MAFDVYRDNGAAANLTWTGHTRLFNQSILPVLLHHFTFTSSISYFIIKFSLHYKAKNLNQTWNAIMFFLAFHFTIIERERDTNVYNLIVSPTNEGDHIHLNPAAILFMPALHFNRQSSYPLLKTTFALSSSSCFLYVLSSLPFFLWPSTSNYNALLKTWPSSLLITWPYQRALFAIAYWFVVSLKPNMSVKSVDLFISLSCTPHIALTTDLSDLRKIPISLFFRHHASLPYSIAGLT